MGKRLLEFFGLTMLFASSIFGTIVVVWAILYVLGIETTIKWRLITPGVVVASAVVTTMLYLIASNKWRQ